jgi:hypothetical protein
MGLLDILSPDSPDGLLALLQRGLLPAQQPQGAPSAPLSLAPPQPPQIVAANQPSPLDMAQWPAGPVGAPTNANAQAPAQSAPAPRAGAPAPGAPLSMAPPAPATDSGPSFGDRLSAGLQSMGHSAGLTSGIGNLIRGFQTGQRQDPDAQASNATMRALQAKGIDPGIIQAAMANPEIMKQLVATNFGPRTVQSLGEGYVYDPRSGKAVRVYEPDDKIPAGFRKTDAGNLEPIPGGPADLAYVKQKSGQEKASNGYLSVGKGGAVLKLGDDGKPVIGPDGKPVVLFNNGGGDAKRMLSDEGADLIAERYLNGEKGLMTGFGRSPADMAEVQNRVASKAKERGLDASQILSNINNEIGAQSAARKSGGIIALNETYATQTEKAIDIAEKASSDVSRGNWVPVNKAIQAFQEGHSDPKLAALGQALETLTQEYARAVGGGHGTVSDKMEAREYLSRAQSHEALVARLNVMRNEIKRAREAAKEGAATTGQIYRDNIIRGNTSPALSTPGGLPEPAATPPAGAPPAGTYTWSPDKGLSQ